jgi:hypothetical protein
VTAKIVDDQMDAIVVAPSDDWRDAGGVEPDGPQDLPQHREPIVVLQLAPGVAAHATGQQLLVEGVKPRPQLQAMELRKQCCERMNDFR